VEKQGKDVDILWNEWGKAKRIIKIVKIVVPQSQLVKQTRPL
jgi:hypothetical protein